MWSGAPAYLYFLGIFEFDTFSLLHSLTPAWLHPLVVHICRHRYQHSNFFYIFFPLAGKPRFEQRHDKKSNRFVLKKIFIPHTTHFIDALIRSVIEKRLDPAIVYKAPTASLALPQPPLPPNIAKVQKPPKAEAIEQFKSRFPKEWHTFVPETSEPHSLVLLLFITHRHFRVLWLLHWAIPTKYLQIYVDSCYANHLLQFFVFILFSIITSLVFNVRDMFEFE